MPKSRKSKEKGMTKAQVVSELASKTSLTKSQVNDVFVSLLQIIESELKGNRPTTIPGLVKIDVRRKEATKARPGINPFTGEKITIKAKPAKNVVKVKALKGLKELV
jgi:nucleoid DNA-binding protein